MLLHFAFILLLAYIEDDHLIKSCKVLWCQYNEKKIVTIEALFYTN